jgi:hypothetical protein
MSVPTHRTCARCGAQNLATAKVCTRCGQPLPQAEDLGRMWSGDGTDPSTQVTAPFHQPRPYTSGPRPYESTSASRPAPAETFPRAPIVNYPPAAPIVTTRARRGPHGCILGGLAVLLILAVVGAFAYTISKPLVSDRVRDELDKGIATQVAAIDDSPRLASAGQLTLTEDEINTEVKQYAGSYEPVKNVRVRILPEEVRVSFDLYGSTSTLRGGLAVENQRIVVVDPSLSGVAGKFLDEDDIVGVFEAQLASLMNLSSVEPTAVDLGDGELTVTTRRKGR